jgi:hypothetical protein
MKTTACIAALAFICLVSPQPAVKAQLLCEITNDPAEVLLSYDDLANFVRALDVMEDQVDSTAVLQAEYLDKASPGLSEYVRANDLGAGDFLAAIRERTSQFVALRDLKGQLASQEEAVRDAFRGLRDIVPNTAFIPVYYFVGIGHAGLHAEPSEYGLLIAMTELASDPSVVRLVLVHETVHVQQALTVGMEEYMQVFGPKMSLLSLALREGIAEYLTYLSTGAYAKKAAHDYLIENERALWTRFESEMNNERPGDWMFAKPSDPDQPVDLGYVMGARIAESFYAAAEDKTQAVQEILSITDYQDFLRKSGYAERFRER